MQHIQSRQSMVILPTALFIYTIILLKSVCLSVGVRKRQVAILARSSREISQTVRIDWQYILSRVRVSVRPSMCFTFIRENPPKTIAKTDPHASVCWMNQRVTHRKGSPSIDRQRPATTWSVNCGHSGDRLSQNGEKQQVKTATTRVYTFTAWKMWFRNYYVAYAFV